MGEKPIECLGQSLSCYRSLWVSLDANEYGYGLISLICIQSLAFGSPNKPVGKRSNLIDCINPTLERLSENLYRLSFPR